VLTGTVISEATDSVGAAVSVTVTHRPEGEIAVFPHPVTTDRATVYLDLTEDAAEVVLEAWDASLHRVWEGRWTNVSWLDGILTIDGLRRWAPGIYLLRGRAVTADGGHRVFPVYKLVIKP
jgi:hypothetical protein